MEKQGFIDGGRKKSLTDSEVSFGSEKEGEEPGCVCVCVCEERDSVWTPSCV